MGKTDGISIPIALLVLAWRVKSLPLMLIPLLCLPASLLFAFCLLDAASQTIKFPNFAPAIYVTTLAGTYRSLVYNAWVCELLVALLLYVSGMAL